MLRAKYWFPSMNHLIGQTIKLFWLSSISTKSHKQEPIIKASHRLFLKNRGNRSLLILEDLIPWSECKESHFYSLPILDGKLKLSIYITSPKVISTSLKTFLGADLISQIFCNLNSSKNFTCPLGKLRTEFTSPVPKSTSPRLSDMTFFARC